MAFALAGSHDRQQADINITPLVDVMLVLLVLFIVTAPAATRRLDAALPQPGAPPATPPAVMHVVVASGDVTSLDGQALAPADLAARLATAAAQPRPTVVEIAADRDADYQSVVRAMAAVRQAGLRDMSLVTR